jgi:dTMP kinase
MKGQFITFEGTEGSGKTTIIDNIEKELQRKGYKVLRTREPGGSKISEQIRNIILNVENTEMDIMTEALLYAASRRQHVNEVIKPHLENGYIILCDRYLDSSLAYQGYARGLGIKKIYELNQYATEGLQPDITFYIDVKPIIGMNRIAKNNRHQDRLDLEKISFHDLVYRGYEEVIKLFPDRIKIIPGVGEIKDVCDRVRLELNSFLEKNNVS